MVSKDELLDKLWPGQVVSEATLTRCLTSVRKAVGDDGTKQEIIETHHGRGYRFIATVTEQSEAALPSSSPDGSDSVTVMSNGQQNDAVRALPSMAEGQEVNTEEADLSAALMDVAPLGSSSPMPTEESSKFQVQSSKPKERRVGFARQRWAMMVVASLLLIAATLGVVRYWPSPIPSPQSLTPSPQVALQFLPLPDKPSVAVLPFVNLTEDPQQEYLADGIAEGILTGLFKLPSVFVIS
jgi:hypothetical protein